MGIFDIFKNRIKELGSLGKDKDRFVVSVAHKKGKNTSLVTGVYSLEDKNGNPKSNSLRKVENGLLQPFDSTSAKLSRKSAVGNKLHEVDNKKLSKTNKRISNKTDIKNINNHLYNNPTHKKTSNYNKSLKKKYHK